MLERKKIPTAPAEQPLNERGIRALAPETPSEANDNETICTPREGERRTFELPAGVWKAMVGCYALFLLALLGATGDARASFAIAISALYVAMFFGTARMILRQSPAQPPSPLGRQGGVLHTICGPLGIREVYGQMLVVPAAITLFAVAILIIRTCLS